MELTFPYKIFPYVSEGVVLEVHRPILEVFSFDFSYLPLLGRKGFLIDFLT